MPFTCDAQVEAIASGLIARTLPKAAWTHGAHFAATLWLLRMRPEMDAPASLPGIIRAYNVAAGGENTDHAGYHETITQASIRAARAFLTAREDAPLFAVCNGLMDSPLGRSDWLFAYWTREVLFSVAARKGWVAPDVRSLPF